MKKAIRNTIIALGMAIMAVSCMDLEPKAQLADGHVWSKASNYSLFANQFYGWTRDFQSSGVSDGPHSDFRSDLLVGTSENLFNKGTNTIPTSDGNYSGNYKKIYYTNLLLKNAETFDDKAAIAVWNEVRNHIFHKTFCEPDNVCFIAVRVRKVTDIIFFADNSLRRSKTTSWKYIVIGKMSNL